MSTHATRLRLEDLPSGRAIPVDVAETTVLLIRRGDEVRATSAWCTHARTFIGEQAVDEDGLLECPMHGAVFSIEDGSLQLGPTCDPLPVYAVTVGEDGALAIEIPDVAETPAATRSSSFGAWPVERTQSAAN